MVVVDHNSAMAFSRNQDPSETFELGAGHQRPLLSPVAAAPECGPYRSKSGHRATVASMHVRLLG
jgi:hypothetical protein